MTDMSDWTKDFFTAPALDAWQRSRSTDETSAEVAFLQQALALGADPQRVLDVACGDGRHAVELSRHGHAVTGVDIAPDNRERAYARARAAGVELEFLLGDAREQTFAPDFDAAYCMGNSFGYFPRAQTQQLLERVAIALRPCARFVLDTASTAESILPELHPQTWTRVDDGLTLLLECDYDARKSVLQTTYTSLEHDRVVDRRTSQHFIFTSGEIVDMLDRAGLQTLELLADLDGSPFELGSERLLLIAERG
jgi:SAM-dependent methyltransferase